MASYFGNHVMHATQSSMVLVSTVLRFDIVELWTEDDGKLHCTYVHAEEGLKSKYPDLITGHYPQHKRKHMRSPDLCELAEKNSTKHYWHFLDEDDEFSSNATLSKDSLTAPFLTEMAHQLDGDVTASTKVFIVGFALEKINCTPSKLKFLSAVGYAIYVAAFDMDEEEDDGQGGHSNSLLDVQEVIVRNQFSFSVTAENALNRESSDSVTSLGATGVTAPCSTTAVAAVAKLGISPLVTVAEASSEGNLSFSRTEQASIPDRMQSSTAMDFSFPADRIPIRSNISNELTFESFVDMRHLVDGSNSNVYLARFNGERVIVKAMKETCEFDSIAMHEFEVEYNLLSRLSHKNIIKLYGAGHRPRRFLVLEFLEGGSLHTMLQKNQSKPAGLTQKLFRKPTFTYTTLLGRAKELAEALNYMHYGAHDGATIIHRDLKPDNIGFSKDGTLKLYDLGLSTCVNRRTMKGQTYHMTGNTGSLRYMAPEVALQKPYSEKVDVYSFAIIVWQMAKDAVPFKGLNREQFMNRVAMSDERPKIDKSFPQELSNLLEACWQKEQEFRPSFRQIVALLENLINMQIQKGWLSAVASPRVHNAPVPIPQSPSSTALQSQGSQEDAASSTVKMQQPKKGPKSSWF